MHLRTIIKFQNSPQITPKHKANRQSTEEYFPKPLRKEEEEENKIIILPPETSPLGFSQRGPHPGSVSNSNHETGIEQGTCNVSDERIVLPTKERSTSNSFPPSFSLKVPTPPPPPPLIASRCFPLFASFTVIVVAVWFSRAGSGRITAKRRER